MCVRVLCVCEGGMCEWVVWLGGCNVCGSGVCVWRVFM